MSAKQEYFENWSVRIRSSDEKTVALALSDIINLYEFRKYSIPYINSILFSEDTPKKIRILTQKYLPEQNEIQELSKELFERIHFHLKGIKKQYANVLSQWGYENGIYRYYHQSFKVYFLQDYTIESIDLFQSIFPEIPLNPWLLNIVKEGTGKVFKPEDNQNWHAVTRPIMEAFFHTKYFLDLLYKFGRKNDLNQIQSQPGWASILYLYNIH